MSDDRYADHDAAWHRDMERMVEEDFDRAEAEWLDQRPITKADFKHDRESGAAGTANESSRHPADGDTAASETP